VFSVSIYNETEEAKNNLNCCNINDLLLKLVAIAFNEHSFKVVEQNSIVEEEKNPIKLKLTNNSNSQEVSSQMSKPRKVTLLA